MFSIDLEELGRLGRDAAVQACWNQWTGLGSPASRKRNRTPASIIDIEALLVASLSLSDNERRLEDMVRWWSRAGSELTSVQRFHGLEDRFPEDVVARSLKRFASEATAVGDRRWRRYGGTRVKGEGRRTKGAEEPTLLEPCALWLRLRAGFGVGSKADILAFLLGLNGAWASVGSITFATGYSDPTIRLAAEEMALARLIRVTDGRPSEYLAPPRPWADLLEVANADVGGRDAPPGTTGGLPRWRYWSEIFGFLLGVVHWSEQVASSSAGSPHVWASRARDLLEKHGKGLMLNHVPAPSPTSFPGLQAPEALARTTEAVVSWIEEVI